MSNNQKPSRADSTQDRCIICGSVVRGGGDYCVDHVNWRTLARTRSQNKRLSSRATVSSALGEAVNTPTFANPAANQPQPEVRDRTQYNAPVMGPPPKPLSVPVMSPPAMPPAVPAISLQAMSFQTMSYPAMSYPPAMSSPSTSSPTMSPPASPLPMAGPAKPSVQPLPQARPSTPISQILPPCGILPICPKPKRALQSAEGDESEDYLEFDMNPLGHKDRSVVDPFCGEPTSHFDDAFYGMTRTCTACGLVQSIDQFMIPPVEISLTCKNCRLMGRQ